MYFSLKNYQLPMKFLVTKKRENYMTDMERKVSKMEQEDNLLVSKISLTCLAWEAEDLEVDSKNRK